MGNVNVRLVLVESEVLYLWVGGNHLPKKVGLHVFPSGSRDFLGREGSKGGSLAEKKKLRTSDLLRPITSPDREREREKGIFGKRCLITGV